MRHLTAIALLLAMSAPLPAEEDAQNAPGPLDQAFAALHGEADQPQQDQPSEADMDIEVVEVFRTETPEELEAALADGYPPPWLEEILNDETIPEEDRYWLDCRVRAVIAQDLHLFFDREGNPVHYDADWIAPGEEYWRECFLVNPPGDVPRVEDGPSPTSNVDMDPGLVVDRFGDEIGEIPFCNFSVLLSRDGRIGVTPTGGVGTRRRSNQCYACFQFPDSGFVEVPIDVIDGYDYALSADGSRSVFTCRFAQVSNVDNTAWVFNAQGELVFKRQMPRRPLSGPSRPAISPDGELLALDLSPDRSRLDAQGLILVISGSDGQMLQSIDNRVAGSMSFSPEGDYLCCSGRDGARVFSTDDLSELSRLGPETPGFHGRIEFRHMSCSEEGGRVAIQTVDRSTQPHLWQIRLILKASGESMVFDETGLPSLSPEGQFLLVQHYSLSGSTNWDEPSALPLCIHYISGGE